MLVRRILPVLAVALRPDFGVASSIHSLGSVLTSAGCTTLPSPSVGIGSCPAVPAKPLHPRRAAYSPARLSRASRPSGAPFERLPQAECIETPASWLLRRRPRSTPSGNGATPSAYARAVLPSGYRRRERTRSQAPHRRVHRASACWPAKATRGRPRGHDCLPPAPSGIPCGIRVFFFPLAL